MRDILAAAKKPVQVVDVSASIDNAGVTPISVSPVQPPSRGGRVITADTPAAAVAQLVNELSQAGVL
jgi:electron transfer flavoprotein alpha/beta subunit